MPKFEILEKGILTPNSKDDPLPYYYVPIIRNLYKARIQQGLNLLDLSYPNVLEFGYGSGVLLPTLTKLSNNVSGLDLCSDPEMVSSVLEKNGISVDLKKGNILDKIYSAEEFDLIVAFSVFEHIDNVVPILQEMNRILKPGGSLLVGMPRVDKFMAMLFEHIGYKTINDHHITSHRIFIESAQRYFNVLKAKTLPRGIPLYYNYLLKKNE